MDNVHAYEVGLVELAQLMADGNDASVRAIDLREELGELEYKLTEEERLFMQNLSSDLYSLESNEFLDSPTPDMNWRQEYINALCERDWLHMLKLLRYEVPELSPIMRARYRADAYYSLGFEVAAKAFADFSFTVER